MNQYGSNMYHCLFEQFNIILLCTQCLKMCSMDINCTKSNQKLATEQNHSSAVFKKLLLLTMFLFIFTHFHSK